MTRKDLEGGRTTIAALLVEATLSLARRHWLLLGLTVAAFLTRFWRLWEPSQVVFDELHFGGFVNGYFTGEYFFDIHPPLGKLILAAAGWIGDFEPGFTFERIGQPYGDTAYIALRAAPALFGSLLVPLVYIIARQLGGSTKAATFGALLVLLDSALLVESRFILVDSILLFFGFLSLALFLAARKRKLASPWWLVLLVLTGLALGATVSTKWTGIGMLGVVGLAALVDLLRSLHRPLRTLLIKALAYLVCLLVIPAGLYYAIWVVHFELLPKSGPGDAYMTSKFRNSLEGATHTSEGTLSAFEKVKELNRTTYTANAGIRAQHPWQSHWWSWPFLPRGVSFWQETNDGQTARIYLLGVPFAWWLATVGSLAFLPLGLGGLLLWRRLNGEARRFLAFGGLMVVGILANWLPFAPIERPVFTYHYFFSLIFSILLASLMYDRLAACYGPTTRFKAVSITVLVLLMLGFLLFTPIAYGYSLPSTLDRLMA